MGVYDEELIEKFKIAYMYSEGIGYQESRDMCGIDNLEDEDFIDNDYEIDEDLDYDERYEIAFEIYKGLAEAGFSPAYTFLGDCYYVGNGVEEDSSIAETYYLKGANSGFARAKECLGTFYANKSEEYYSPNNAAKWYKEAADDGLEMAKFLLAQLTMSCELEHFTATDGVRMLTELADDEVYYAQEALGIIFFEGVHVDADYGKAVTYLTDATEDCVAPDALTYLAACYYDGLGCECDVKSAIEILMAVEEPVISKKTYADYNSYGVCCYYLGMAYTDGIEGIISQDIKKGEKYFIESAAAGYAPAKAKAPKKPSRLSFLKKL